LVFGILSLVFGILSLASALWFPTLSAILGLVAVAFGLFGVRRAADGGDGAAAGARERRVAMIGLGIGAGAVLATIVIVIITTWIAPFNSVGWSSSSS
jgi:hypothetical protein